MNNIFTCFSAGPSYSPASASWVAGITGMYHHARLILFFYLFVLFCLCFFVLFCFLFLRCGVIPKCWDYSVSHRARPSPSLKSGLALVTYLTNKRWCTWPRRASETRSQEALQLPFQASWNTYSWNPAAMLSGAQVAKVEAQTEKKQIPKCFALVNHSSKVTKGHKPQHF